MHKEYDSDSEIDGSGARCPEAEIYSSARLPATRATTLPAARDARLGEADRRMKNILVFDIGNTYSKCFIYEVSEPNSDGTQYQTQCLYQEVCRTNRGHPWDLVDTCRNMIIRAMDACEGNIPKHGIFTAFGDAFVYYDPKNNRRPRFVFADEPVPDDIRYELDIDYQTSGFPTGNIEITGVRALRAKHKAAWKSIVPVNVAIGREVGGNANWWHWDTTQASATGECDLRAYEWFNKDGIVTCRPYDEVGMFRCMSILAGGLDNAFIDTTEQTPYIVAGTWLVVSTIHDEFRPTETQRQHGVRWFVSGNGRYLAQTVRRSERPLTDQRVHDILSDFQAMGLGGGEYQKIRVLGSYSKELAKKLNAVAAENYFDFQFQDEGEQHRQTAIYVYQRKA